MADVEIHVGRILLGAGKDGVVALLTKNVPTQFGHAIPLRLGIGWLGFVRPSKVFFASKVEENVDGR